MLIFNIAVGFSAVILGCLIGCYLVPVLCHKLLNHKYLQTSNYWEEQLEGYKAFKAEFNRPPIANKKGKEGILGLWVQEQMVRAEQKTLTQEQLVKLINAGFSFLEKNSDPSCLISDADKRKKFSFNPTWKGKLALALTSAVTFLCIALVPGSTVIKICWGLIYLIATLICIIDVKTHIIPFELCGILLVVGLFYQYVCFGINSLLLAGLAAIGVYTIFKVVNWVLSRMGHAGSIGNGDLRLVAPITLICGWPGMIYGLFVMALSLLTVRGVVLVADRKSLREPFPMAPYLCAWLAFGIISLFLQ